MIWCLSIGRERQSQSIKTRKGWRNKHSYFEKKGFRYSQIVPRNTEWVNSNNSYNSIVSQQVNPHNHQCDVRSINLVTKAGYSNRFTYDTCSICSRNSWLRWLY